MFRLNPSHNLLALSATKSWVERNDWTVNFEPPVIADFLFVEFPFFAVGYLIIFIRNRLRVLFQANSLLECRADPVYKYPGFGIDRLNS